MTIQRTVELPRRAVMIIRLNEMFQKQARPGFIVSSTCGLQGIPACMSSSPSIKDVKLEEDGRSGELTQINVELTRKGPISLFEPSNSFI